MVVGDARAAVVAAEGVACVADASVVVAAGGKVDVCVHEGWQNETRHTE